MPKTEENEIEPWDYVKTYKTDDSSLLSLADAPFNEVLYFLVRNCYSAKEMKEKMDKISQCDLVDKEISESIGDFLKDIVGMGEERDKLMEEMTANAI